MRKIAIVAALATIATAQPAFAAAKTSDMLVTLNVFNSCTLTAPEELPFGSVANISDASASDIATVNCTVDSGYTLSIDNGQNYANGSRHMVGTADPTKKVAYYIDINGAGGSVSGTGTGAAQNYNLKGTITTTGSVAAGDYSDTVVVALNY